MKSLSQDRKFLSGIVLCLCLSSCTGMKSTLTELPLLDNSKFAPAVRLRIEPAYLAARSNSEDANVVGKLGMLLDAYEQYEAAAACYQRAHMLDPRSFRWAYYLGNVRAAQGRSTEAIQALREALSSNADYVPARVRLAEALLAENRPAESANEYRSVVSVRPDNAAAHYGLGRAYALTGESAKAVDFYRKACDLFPAYGAAHYALALLYRKESRSQESDIHFRAYERNRTASPLEDDPLRREIGELNAGPLPHIHRAAELERAGNIAEAVAEHERALEIDPKLVQAHVNLISLYGKLGQPAKAEAHYQTSISLDPKQADAYYNYGVLLFGRRQYAEAEKNFREAIQTNPTHAQAHHNLGFLFEQKGDLTKALAEYERAIAGQADYRLAYFHAGRILANRKQYDAAIAHFLKAVVTEDEQTPAYLYALAAAYARSGNRSEAARIARRARTGAIAFGQSKLLASIDKDLRTLERP